MTTEQKKLSQRYLLYRMLTNMWFVGAVWLFFYRLFINDQQVGFLDGMAFTIGLVAEVPSGALADKWGRDRIVRFGWLLAGAGIFVQALGGSFFPLFIGQAILMIGVAFVSGADEALFFDKLAFKRDSLNWRKLVTRGSQFALTGSLVATVVGGLLHNLDARLPWILTSTIFILSAILVWPVKDTRPKSEKQKIVAEIKDYLLGIKTGFSQFHSSKLRLYIPLIIAVQGLFYTTGWGLLRLVLLDRFGFKPFHGSVIVAISCLIAVVVLSVIHKYAESISERFILTSISLLAAGSLLLSLGKIGLWGGLLY